MATLKWNGAQIAAKTQLASRIAVQQTMAKCVDTAKHEHPWRDRTGFLQGSIWIMQGATIKGTKVQGRWGDSANYALFMEIGTSRIGPAAIAREGAAQGNMWAVPDPQPKPGISVRQDFTILPPGSMDRQEEFVTLHRPSTGTGPLNAQRPYLRPAADRQYPLLAMRIRLVLDAIA